MSGLVSEGAWGALAGATLGAPHKGKTAYTRLAFYDPIPLRMAPHESLDAWWVWLSHLKARRSRGSMGSSFHSHWSSTTGESAYGIANLNLGFGPTLSGRLRNPLGQGSLGLGRAVFWGLAFHGQPDEAAEWAYYDASLDHHGDGRDLAACLAWMCAAAKPGLPSAELIKVFRQVLPASSVFLGLLPEILEACAGRGVEATRELTLSLPLKLPSEDSEHAALTMATIVSAIVTSPVRFGPAVLKAAGAGGASDQAGMAVGALNALLSGLVGKEWKEPLGVEYVASHALRGLDVGSGIAQFVGWVEEIHSAYKPVLPPAPQPAPVEAPQPEPAPQPETAPGAEAAAAPTEPSEPGAEPEAGSAEAPQAEVPAPEPVQPPQPPAPTAPPVAERVAALIHEDAAVTMSEQSGVEMTWRMLDQPVIGPQQSLRLTMAFRNVSHQDKEITPELQAPEGWKSATRLSAFRLPPGAVQIFPLVLQSPARPVVERVYAKLKWGSAEYKTPILPAQLWHMVGPFVNHEGTGFDKLYPAETQVKLGQSFLGRSDLPVKWEARWMPGIVFDLEKEFKGGPGAILLWARVRFPSTGRHRLFVTSGIGVVAVVDGAKVLAYHDHHKPDLRKTDKYSGVFTTNGEATVMIKVLRDRKPLDPLVIAFYGPDGAVVHPIAFLPMD